MGGKGSFSNLQRRKLNLTFLHAPSQMIYCKVTEIFAEAIPAGCLQMYAFVQSPRRSTAAAGSILISALTTGFGSALISYGEFLLRDEMLSTI